MADRANLLVSALWSLGSEDKARDVAKELAGHAPQLLRRPMGTRFPYRRQEDLDTLINPLRMAGLPE